ncbi:MAG: Cof-type HAD-IIB family hydrolase [Bacteroidota bacterium]
MVDYRVVCSDVDGTLLNSKRELSEATIKSVELLNKRRIPFVMVSARMPKAMRPLQIMLGAHYPIVCYNGAYIESELKVDGFGVELFSNPIEIEPFLDLLKFMDGNGIHFGTYHKNEWFVNQEDYWTRREMNNTKITPEVKDMEFMHHHFEAKNHGPHKIMIMGDYEKIEPLESELRHRYGDYIDIYRSKDTYLELNAKAVSKSTSLDVLSEYFNHPISEFMAFGDNYNDVSMIRKAGFGVAVENARNEVKAVANEITAQNIKDGVSKTIDKYFHL